MLILQSKMEEKNKVMKLKAFANVHFVDMTSFTFLT